MGILKNKINKMKWIKKAGLLFRLPWLALQPAPWRRTKTSFYLIQGARLQEASFFIGTRMSM